MAGNLLILLQLVLTLNIIAAASQNSFFFVFFVLYNGVGEKQARKNTKKRILTCRCNDIQR
jgi:hypothetical protein